MHEFHIAKDIAEEIKRRAAAEKRAKVKAVGVELGALLRFDAGMCAGLLQQLLQDTPAAGAEFNVTVMPALAQCAECGKKFDPDPDVPQCPECDSLKVEIISGEGWKIMSMK